jgi:hypothetical protein
MSLKKNKNIRIILTLSLLGIVFPYIFHVFGSIGRIFLPMHFFVIIGGYILSPLYALIISIFVPIVSSFLTGMPVIYPILPIVIVELMTYVLVIVFLKRRGIYKSLILAMISGRIAATLTVFLLGKTMGLAMDPIRYIESCFITGLPGIIFQIIIIPIIVTLINNHSSTWRDLHESNERV